jgi:serine/threonine-protein kinase
MAGSSKLRAVLRPPDSGGGEASGATRRPDPLQLSEPGRVIAGKYRLDRVLGRGGMGIVAAAHHLELDRPVAVKFLLTSPSESLHPNQRFAREARAIAKMRSEHVVRVFDIGDEAGVPFIVMEHLVGNDLAAELEQGPLPLEAAVGYVLQACEAIGEAHSLGIVHRDLKPSNLFLADVFGGRRMLKVLDFGVSKWLKRSPIFETPFVTSESSFIGTPAYISPEQLTRPESVDERADVWALGVVLYECVSGQLPFRGDSVPEICAEILKSAPAPLPAVQGVPPAFAELIDRCLRKVPSERYASVIELARALAPFAARSSGSVLESIELLGAAAPARVTEPARSASNDDIAHATTLGFSQEASSSLPRTAVASRKWRTWRSVLSFTALAALAIAGAILIRGAERAAKPAGALANDQTKPSAAEATKASAVHTQAAAADVGTASAGPSKPANTADTAGASSATPQAAPETRETAERTRGATGMAAPATRRQSKPRVTPRPIASTALPAASAETEVDDPAPPVRVRPPPVPREPPLYRR